MAALRNEITFRFKLLFFLFKSLATENVCWPKEAILAWLKSEQCKRRCSTVNSSLQALQKPRSPFCRIDLWVNRVWPIRRRVNLVSSSLVLKCANFWNVSFGWIVCKLFGPSSSKSSQSFCLLDLILSSMYA